MTPCPKVWTIKASSWVWSLTVNALNLFRKSFEGSLCLCFTPKKVERDWWSGLVNDELFPEQFRKLVEEGYVVILGVM